MFAPEVSAVWLPNSNPAGREALGARVPPWHGFARPVVSR
jgi:hypothetical protein